MYAVGATVKPALRGASPSTRLTTKPDCCSLFSRLQSAHSPVRGQVEGFVWPDAPTVLDAALLAAGMVRMEPERAGCDESRPHALTVAPTKNRKIRAVMK
jgi:hypothetical protein